MTLLGAGEAPGCVSRSVTLSRLRVGRSAREPALVTASPRPLVSALFGLRVMKLDGSGLALEDETPKRLLGVFE